MHETSVTFYAGRTTLSGVPCLLRWRASTVSLVLIPVLAPR